MFLIGSRSFFEYSYLLEFREEIDVFFYVEETVYVEKYLFGILCFFILRNLIVVVNAGTDAQFAIIQRDSQNLLLFTNDIC